MSSKIEFGNVIALTLVDCATLVDGAIVPDTLVRVGVRNCDTNLTHANIVSVPTQRIPISIADALLRGSASDLTQGKIIGLPNSWVSNSEHSGHIEVIYAVEALMSMKLGVSEALERNEIAFLATPSVYTINIAHYPNLIDVPNAPYPSDELIRMINLQVNVERGCDLFPESTESYLHSRWVCAKDYARMMKGKDVSALGLDGFKFCVDGLCVSTTNDIIMRALTARAA